MRPRNVFGALEKTRTFFATYFGPVRPEKFSLHLLYSLSDVENRVPQIRRRAVQLFGEHPAFPQSMDWVLKSEDYKRAVDFILDGRPWPKGPVDPIWLSFDCALDWKESALPKIEWPEEFLDTNDPFGERLRQAHFGVKLRRCGFISLFGALGTGLLIPVSQKEPASYEFLREFSAAAPFKMNPKHFRVLGPTGKNGKLASKRPDVDTMAQLEEVIK